MPRATGATDLQSRVDTHVVEWRLRRLCQLESRGTRLQIGDLLYLVTGDLPGESGQCEAAPGRRNRHVHETRGSLQSLPGRARVVPVERDIADRSA